MTMQADILVLIGIVTPLLVAIVTSVKTSATVKGVLALIFSVVIGVATCYAQGLLSAADLLGSALAAYGAAQVAYVVVFKPAGITSWLLENLGRKDAA
jgi:hypothetical protein